MTSAQNYFVIHIVLNSLEILFYTDPPVTCQLEKKNSKFNEIQ